MSVFKRPGDETYSFNFQFRGRRFSGNTQTTNKKDAVANLRQAYYLCEIVDRLRPFARYQERFEAIGWTKTQVIARGLNKQNLKQRLEWAETKGNFTRILPILIKGETEPPEQKRVVLYFTKDEYQAFKEAVEQNGGSTAPRKNLVGKEAAVMALIKKAALSR